MIDVESPRDVVGRRPTAVLALCLAGLLGISVAGLESLLVHDTTELRSSIDATNVSEGENLSVGLNAEGNLDFGTLPYQASVEKTVNLSASNLSRVRASTSGNISEVLKYRRTMFVSGQHNMEIVADPSKPGYYSGSLELDTATANGELAKEWLELQRSLFSQ